MKNLFITVLILALLSCNILKIQNISKSRYELSGIYVEGNIAIDRARSLIDFAKRCSNFSCFPNQEEVESWHVSIFKNYKNIESIYRVKKGTYKITIIEYESEVLYLFVKVNQENKIELVDFSTSSMEIERNPFINETN